MSGQTPIERRRAVEAERAKIARNIAQQALALAKLARIADLPNLGFLLETAALEASAGQDVWDGSEGRS